MASTFPNENSAESGADATFPTGAGARMSSGSAEGAGPTGSSAGSDADRDLMRRVVQGAHEAVDRLADKAIPAVERLRSTVNDATDRIQERATQAGDLKDEWTDSLRTTIREHPLAAVATALAVGMIISRLTSSDR